MPKGKDLTTAEKLEGWMLSHSSGVSVRKKVGNRNTEIASPYRFRTDAAGLMGLA